MAPLDPALALEAKVLTVLAFRNGPIEDLHAGKICPVCSGNSEYSHITDAAMKKLMQSAVNQVYRLLWQRENDAEGYAKALVLGARYTTNWDEPVPKT
jgi:hypothetical protein